jgi:hypothetical protein
MGCEIGDIAGPHGLGEDADRVKLVSAALSYRANPHHTLRVARSLVV